MAKLKPNAWRRIGASETIVDWISNGVPLVFKQEPQKCMFLNRVASGKQEEFVDAKIGKLLRKGAVKKVEPWDVHCILPLRCVPKKRNKLHLVLDCRHVNDKIGCPSFSQEGIQAVADQIEDGDNLISIDLESGFHHVPVKIQYQKFLGFRWKNEFFVWCVLAFGIKSAPYYFHKILRPVVAFFRKNGIRNALFVDDFLLMIKKRCTTDHIDFVLHSLAELGWDVNYEKSCLKPSESCEFIGFVVHSHGRNGPWIQVMQKKLHKLKRHLSYAISHRCVSARFLAKIGGECVAMTKAIIPAKLLLHNLYRNLAGRKSWDSMIDLDLDCVNDLKWWFNVIQSWNGAPLHSKSYDIQVATDASGSGWGGCVGIHKASGTWNKEVTMQPSNYRELLAIYKSILSFQHILKNRKVQILCDNVMSVAHVNRFGDSNKVMSDLMTTIFVVTRQLGISLSAKYLAGKDNGRADGLLRILSPYEWHLHLQVFRQLDMMWGPHTVDRFTSEMTCQVPRYNSLFLDPGTEAVNAMGQNWHSENNFINAPFWMLGKIIKKLKKDQAQATVIAPKWPAQTWYRDLIELSISHLIQLKNCPRIMLKKAGIPEPLKNRKWKIFAWRISGMIS